MSGKKKQRSKMPPEKYLQCQLRFLEGQWDSVSKNMVWQLTQGGGFNNVHVLDSLRTLQAIYYRMAAAHDTLRYSQGAI